uniref:Putative secreted protein n=1 Tax=Xenopsylla cheopis TaxID=163159 RepID=A0A6M2DX93_XENCH
MMTIIGLIRVCMRRIQVWACQIQVLASKPWSTECKILIWTCPIAFMAIKCFKIHQWDKWAKSHHLLKTKMV